MGGTFAINGEALSKIPTFQLRCVILVFYVFVTFKLIFVCLFVYLTIGFYFCSLLVLTAVNLTAASTAFKLA